MQALTRSMVMEKKNTFMSTTADIYSHLDANAKSEAGRAIESVLSINSESED